MSIICPNMSNPDVAREFNELKEATNERAAYAIWSLNNGNGIDKAPNGAKSKLFNDLLEYYGEEYEEEHTSVYNATLLEALKIPELQKEFLDMLAILMNVDFSYELKQILASEKSAKYNNYYYKSWWLTDAQKLRRMLLRFANKYILIDE